jgi:hypothetical protein
MLTVSVKMGGKDRFGAGPADKAPGGRGTPCSLFGAAEALFPTRGAPVVEDEFLVTGRGLNPIPSSRKP